MTIEYIPKDATHPFGAVIVKNDKYAPGQPCIQFNHGIKERGSGSKVDLSKIGKWAGFGGPGSLATATDVFGFNIVAIQTAHDYENGEIPYGVTVAKDYLQADPNRIYFLGHSLGMFGFSVEVSKDASIATPYAVIIGSAMGPGNRANTAKNIAASGRPVWLFTSAIDHDKDANGIGTDSGTSFEETDNLYNALKALNAPVWETKYNSRDHNGVLSIIVGGIGKAHGSWSFMNTSIATGLNNPKSDNLFDWLLSNSLDKPIHTPLDAPVPVTAPVPEKVAKFILYEDGTWSPVQN
jgi:hypothetical protein